MSLENAWAATGRFFFVSVSFHSTICGSQQNSYVEDGRAWQLVLTRRGRAALATVEAIYDEIEARWAEVIGRRALEAVRTHLVDAVRGLHEGELPPVRPLW